ncbi:UDP-glucose:glycoprotein glucosyltransferase [Uranotaenia lowii]|uniref:UDP-glucose:glycoprotein glucosyltransferase n=1 Tax=Uranotaenia lowii TaxID=190385 RepID=UPI00247A3088|nr:UDP-glucose:glycoprotein glucosyltransferase [Uranotaenia lowii]XP_055601752.1 UDP-glucose:glycoprotein glucosyltransferase [Uranotaenia lowii]
MIVISLLLGLLLVSQSVSANSKSHPVTTQLSAKWGMTPIQLEIAEFIEEENVNLFWDYVELLNKIPGSLYHYDTDEKRYSKAITLAENLLGIGQTRLLKLSLSLHSFSTKVQAHLQVAHEILKQGDCDSTAFVSIGGKLACDVDELYSVLKSIDADPKNVETFSLDHVFPGSENNSLTAILYAEIGTKEFKVFNDILKTEAETGNIRYVLRHFVKQSQSSKLRLSGYGVELHLKSTEYKSQDDSPQQQDHDSNLNDENLESEVEGFDFIKLKERFGHLSHSLDRYRNALLEKHEEIAPLKAWEFQELGLQASQKIAQIQGEEALQILQFVSQNFPTQAKSLLVQTVSEDFKKEMRHNIEVFGRNLNLQPPDSALFLNGLFFDGETIDTITLLDTLRSEMRVLEGLNKINIRGKTAAPLLALDLASTSKEFAIDIRDSAITWVNDLENDAQYRRWPGSVMDLLRPTFPGMLRNIRKNLFNLVLVIDPISSETPGRDIVKLAESFVVHSAPVRVGLVFESKSKSTADADYRGIVCAFNYVYQKKGSQDALGYLTDLFASVPNRDITLDDIKKQLKKTFSKLKSDEVNDIVGEDSDFDYGRHLSQEFVNRIGLKNTPQALLNGVLLPQSTLNSDDFEETILTEIMQQTPTIQKAVYKGELNDGGPVIDFLMEQPHVMPRLNQRILSSEDPIFLDVSGNPHPDLEDVTALAQLANSDLTATLMKHLKYLGGKSTYQKFMGHRVHFLTVWVVADLETPNGFQLLNNALRFMKSTSGTRVAFIPNVDGSKAAQSDLKKNLNGLVWAAINTLSTEDATEMVINLLKLHQNQQQFNVPESVVGFLPAAQVHLKMLRVYNQRVLKMRASVNGIVANGRLLGPFEIDELFDTEDFNLLERFSGLHYTDRIRTALKDSVTDNDDVVVSSDTIFKLVSILVPRQQSKSRYTMPNDVQENYTVVKLPPKSNDLPHFEVVAVLDPASKGAQKLSSLLVLLRNVINCNMRLFLCAVDKHSDMPVKTFYRFVVEPELKFSSEGKLAAGPYAKFSGLPANTLLTQSLNAPENWLVEVVRSVYDLDNIKLSEINGPVHSEYELEYLLLEGHCFDTTTGSPPRGLQITLGTEEQPIIVDTIVMANLGYFQLKANPGAWILKLRHGKSADIYDITNADGPNTIHSVDGTQVIISSLKSHVLKLRVTKKPGKANADLLGEEKDTTGGIWDSISSIVGSSEGQDQDVLNIFSVASGHLYERLLRIMMLSLLKHTKTPVKFWFLKNYLSPQFIDFLPHMSQEYNFQYELVQYKWPRWLHQQTEKQRVIWGYKILFLDVLFPLDVKKIIFVDADQIVRADMKELNDFDLGGAPYGYTPFCDSRKEMEGFRFWKQGYWKNHLQGRRYHISALYVVDLKRFRKIAAGDRIRGQYQALSQDPNSLSNLDQDLPNNMIHQVAIKSLPQEWLWCETWCSSETLQYAKTIDLCNNPQTKEAKLTAAQRIVPEWKDYDQEIKRLQAQIDELEHHEESQLEHSEDKENAQKNNPHTEL